jgi:hypothetical protein
MIVACLWTWTASSPAHHYCLIYLVFGGTFEVLGDCVCLSCQAGGVRVHVCCRHVCWHSSLCACARRATAPTKQRCISETNRIQLVLFGTQNRTFGPCLATINRTLLQQWASFALQCFHGTAVTETNRVQVVLVL